MVIWEGPRRDVGRVAVARAFRNRLLGALAVVVAAVVVSGFAAGVPHPKILWRDQPGDVTLPNADMLSGSAAVFNGMVDLRLSFLARPFPDTATHTLSWCVDTDGDPGTGGVCGWGVFAGADWFISLEWVPGRGLAASMLVDGMSASVDVRPYLWYDPGNVTLRLLFPLSLMGDDGDFHYAVESAFGGSWGVNDQAPRRIDFANPHGCFASGFEELPFGGSPWYP